MSARREILELLGAGPRRKEASADEKRARKEAAERLQRHHDVEALTGHRGAPATRAPERPNTYESASTGLRGELERAWADWDGR